MKRILCILTVFLLLMPTVVTAEGETPAEPVEIRNQNIFVPTKKGVQRATYEEALKIDALQKQPLTSLTTAYLLGDYKSGKILESYNIDEVKPMASMSKLVSVFVVFDEISRGALSRGDVVLIDREAALLGGSSYKLKENDTKTVGELLEASLIVSGNDAVTALAKHVAGSKEAFVSMMNDKCKELGLKNAHMVNPTGLTDYTVEDYNKMTLREMFIISRELISKHPEVLDITSKEKIEEPDRNFIEYNTNPTLGITEGIDGLKTGYTGASGRCLIATGVKKGEAGKTLDTRLIGITTGSKNDWARYVAANKLMAEGFEKYKYILIGNPEEAVSKIKVEDASVPEVEVYEKARGSVLWNGKSDIKRELNINPGLKAPLAVGDVVGSVKYIMDGEEIQNTDLIVKDRVTQKGIIFKIKEMYENIFLNIKKAA